MPPPASTTRRRKLLSTAAALALAWPFAFIALAAALATKFAATIMITIGDHINNTWDAAVRDEGDTTIVTKLTVANNLCSSLFAGQSCDYPLQV